MSNGYSILLLQWNPSIKMTYTQVCLRMVYPMLYLRLVVEDKPTKLLHKLLYLGLTVINIQCNIN